MTISHITSLSQLNGILSKSKDKLTVRPVYSSSIVTAVQLLGVTRSLISTQHGKSPPFSIEPENDPTSTVVRCGPCHAIAPTFEALSKRYTNANFLKCDVDAASEVAKAYSVSAMYVGR